MKKIVLCLIVCLTNCFATKYNPIKITGKTNYTQQHTKSLMTEFTIEHRLILKEPQHKKWSLYLGNIIVPDYDHFGKQFKINTFTTIGIDF